RCWKYPVWGKQNIRNMESSSWLYCPSWELFQCADDALYAVKRKNKNGYRIIHLDKFSLK
ncbi:MAG: hypothetical protein RR496_07535, partial [Lachnospiraceae bacterium]